MFSVKIRLAKRFNNVLERKKTFFEYKDKIFQTPTNCTFPKGLTHAFGKKMQFFSFFVFGQNKIRNKVNNVLDRKKTLFEYKVKSFQSPTNCTFPKGLTHAFGKKNAIFFIFCFRSK